MKKKILHIVESFGGGVYSFLVDLINETDKEYDITIAYGVRQETLENFKGYFSDRVKFIKIENFARNITLKKDLNAFKEIKSIIGKENPDIIHLHSSKAGALGRLAVSGKKIKMFYNPHGFSFLKKDDSKIKRIMYWIIEKTLAILNNKCTIIGCSQGEYKEAKRLNKNSICISNGINVEKLNKEIEKFKSKEIDNKNLKICTVGRIDYSKNPEMFNKIANTFPNLQFTWIGDGELRNKLTSSNITITGWKKREEVLKILNEQDVFILASLWEGLSISLLEAMVMKKTCIVSNCTGNKEVIINEENGFIVEKFEDYIKAINKILNNKNEISKEKIYENVNNRFNLKNTIEQYKKIYNQKKTILHIVNSNAYSGLEKVAMEIIKDLEDDYNLYYVTKQGPIDTKLEEENIKKITIEKMSIKEIRRICKKYKPDILHVHDYTATIVSAFSFVGIPIISHLHNNSPWLKKIHPYCFALLFSSFNIKKILTVSDSIEKEYVFSKLIHSKIKNIGNPVSVKKVTEKLPTDLIKEYDICFCGRLTKQKNPIKFIKIINDIKKEYPSVKTIMLGDGELRQECENKIKELELENNIILKGFVNEPYTYMAKSKIFCLTSDWEGYGLVAFEAMSIGLPCIVSKVGGLVNIVDDKCGKLCDTQEDFVNAITQILADPNEYNKLVVQALKKSKKMDNYTEYMTIIRNLYRGI